jgi:hypothetical protein
MPWQPDPRHRRRPCSSIGPSGTWPPDGTLAGRFAERLPPQMRGPLAGSPGAAAGKVLPHAARAGATSIRPRAVLQSRRRYRWRFGCKPSEKGSATAGCQHGGDQAGTVTVSGSAVAGRIGRCRTRIESFAGESGTVCPVDAWSRVAATFDNKVMRLYVNGKAVGTLERRGFINRATPSRSGAHGADMDRARFPRLARRRARLSARVVGRRDREAGPPDAR